MVLPHLECGRLANQRSPGFGSVLAKSCFGSFRPGQRICFFYDQNNLDDGNFDHLHELPQPTELEPTYPVTSNHLVNHLSIVVNINIFIIYIDLLSFNGEINEVLHL